MPHIAQRKISKTDQPISEVPLLLLGDTKHMLGLPKGNPVKTGKFNLLTRKQPFQVYLPPMPFLPGVRREK